MPKAQYAIAPLYRINSLLFVILAKIDIYTLSTQGYCSAQYQVFSQIRNYFESQES